MLQFICGLFIFSTLLFHVFSERDWHTQAVEKHRASPEKGHADCLPARSVQVCFLYVSLLTTRVALDANDRSLCMHRGFPSLLPLFSLQWEQMQQMEEKECGALRGTDTHSAWWRHVTAEQMLNCETVDRRLWHCGILKCSSFFCPPQLITINRWTVWEYKGTLFFFIHLTHCIFVPSGLSAHTHVELPYFSKFLLIAAYLASYNPARTDKRFFMKVEDVHTVESCVGIMHLKF